MISLMKKTQLVTRNMKFVIKATTFMLSVLNGNPLTRKVRMET